MRNPNDFVPVLTSSFLVLNSGCVLQHPVRTVFDCYWLVLCVHCVLGVHAHWDQRLKTAAAGPISSSPNQSERAKNRQQYQQQRHHDGGGNRELARGSATGRGRRLEPRLGRCRPAPEADERLLGDFSSALATEHFLLCRGAPPPRPVPRGPRRSFPAWTYRVVAFFGWSSGRAAAMTASAAPNVHTMVGPVGRSSTSDM